MIVSEKVDVVLDVSAVILETLRDVARLSPVPGLSEAAGIAISIAGIVGKARNNKDDFRSLAEDSAELVYTLVYAHKNVTQPEDVPRDLIDSTRQLVGTLTLVQKFAEKGARRNFFMAMIRSNADAKRIRGYREKLRQSMRVFALQSDISIRCTLHRLQEQQVEMMDELKNREESSQEQQVEMMDELRNREESSQEQQVEMSDGRTEKQDRKFAGSVLPASAGSLPRPKARLK